MDGCNVSFIQSHPSIDIFAKLVNYLKWRRLVIFKSKWLTTSFKAFVLIASFST
jgi:hypothetical protein